MVSIQIRKATSTDLRAIHELVGELAIYENAEKEFVATLEQYTNDFQSGIFDALVACSDDQIVGMMLYYMAYSTWKGKMLFLEDFVVRSAWRQSGVGQLLFDALKKEAQNWGCKLIKWQVLDWNTPAIRFYEKNHATIEKDWWNGKYFL